MNLIAEAFRVEIVKYMDSDGLVTPIPHDGKTPNGSGNGLLYSSLYYLALMYLKDFRPGDIDGFAKILCDSSVIPGLLKRGPHHGDQQAMDDYMGVTAACAALAMREFNSEIFYYGKRKTVLFSIPLAYVYNNVNPGSMRFKDGRINWNAWLGRYPQFVAHLHYSLGESPGFFHSLSWLATIIFSAFTTKPNDQDGWLFSWLLIITAERQSIFHILCAKLWRWRLKRVHGNIRTVLGKVLNPGHPIALAFPDWVT